MISESTSSILMLVALFALMYFMLIRPQRKKEKQVQEMRNNIKPGDEIVTIGGIIGTVVRVKEEEVIIQVGGDKTRMELAKWGISGLVKEEKVSVAAAPSKEETDGKASAKKIRKLGRKEETEAAEPAAEAAPAVEEAPGDAE